MALSFPTTVTFTTQTSDLEFEDGTKLHVPQGTTAFTKPIAVVIDRVTSGAGVTNILKFTPSVDLGSQTFRVTLPLTEAVGPEDALLVRDNWNFPDLGDCVPQPDITVAQQPQYFATFLTPHMWTVQVSIVPNA